MHLSCFYVGAYSYPYVYIYLYIYVYIHVHMYVYIYVHVCICIYTYTLCKYFTRWKMPSRWRHDLSLVSILLPLQCTIPASAWAPVSHCVSIYDVVFILSWSDEVRQCKYQPPFATFRMSFRTFRHGVATISRLLTNIRIFCKRALKKRAYSAKETYDFKEPAHWATPPHQFYNDDYYYQNGVALVSRID